jgi:hypothetical protein
MWSLPLLVKTGLTLTDEWNRPAGDISRFFLISV